MKYKFKKVEFEVAPLKTRGGDKWIIRGREQSINEKGEIVGNTRRFNTFDTEEEAIAYYEQMKDYSYLSSEDRIERHYTLKTYYGCSFCKDARNRVLEEPDEDTLTQAMFCIHKECPYAEEIEKHGGYHEMLKKIDMDEMFNFCFGEQYFNNWFGREEL